MRDRFLTMGLLVGAGVANLPLVYAMLAVPDLHAAIGIATGLLSMGLAWAGGAALEGRRHGSVRVIAALGVLEVAIPLVPAARETLGVSAIAWPLLAAVLSLNAIGMTMRARRAVAA